LVVGRELALADGFFRVASCLTIIIAAITSTFVARAQHEQEETQTADADRAEARLDYLAERLDRMETTLLRLTGV
jgi:3-dehydroquinate dehydratase